MFNELPDEINKKIIDNCKEIINPIHFYDLKNINKDFYKIIVELKDLYSNYKDEDIQKINDDLNLLCCKRTSIKTFQWLFNNQIFLKLNHINNLIINNRFDIIQLCNLYPRQNDILFNRFYLYSINEDYLQNPIYISTQTKNYEILNFLLLKNQNNLDDILIFLFDISLKKKNKELLNFCIHNYYDKIKNKINNNINQIISKIKNIEDILFHLYLKNDIKITNHLLINLIKNNYNQLFRITFNNLIKKDYHILLRKSIQENNYEIFNFILNDNKVKLNNDDFTNMIILNLNVNHKNTKDFIYNLLNNFKKQINLDSSLIDKCIQSDINTNTIRRLIYEGFYYSYYEIKLAIEKKNIELVRDLSNNFKEE